jgi:cytochrome c551
MNKRQATSRKFQGGLRTLLHALLVSLILFNCSGEKSANEETLDRLNQKELQLYTAGRQLYTQYCQNCHMEDGNGLGQLIPPLATSDYLLDDLERAARIIKYGQKGPIVVNRKDYNQPMPANPQMTNQEIQMILTYIGNAWGNQSEVLTVEAIQAALQAEEN